MEPHRQGQHRRSAATAIEAATYAGTQAAIDRAGVRSFHYLTGIWAGPKDKRAKEKAEA